MLEVLGKLDHEEVFGLTVVIVLILAGSLVAAIAVAATTWRRVRVTERELALKQQMLEKGMSSAEIEQVMRASQEPARVGSPIPTGNEAYDKAALVEHLVNKGYDAGDIERVLAAYQSDPTAPVDRF